MVSPPAQPGLPGGPGRRAPDCLCARIAVGPTHLPSLRASPRRCHPCTRFTLVYGGLIYQLLGDGGESAFAHDWGVGLAIDHATQWKSVLQSSLEAALVLTLMDRLSLVPGNKWLEARRTPPCGAAAALRAASLPTRGREPNRTATVARL